MFIAQVFFLKEKFLLLSKSIFDIGGYTNVSNTRFGNYTLYNYAHFNKSCDKKNFYSYEFTDVLLIFSL